MTYTGNFPWVWRALRQELLDNGDEVPVETWHGMRVEGDPNLVTVELANVRFGCRVPYNLNDWQVETKPNMPWAEMHFQERVGGRPLNPPPSHEYWPWYHAQHQDDKEQKFSHTYPERMWPKHIGGAGIRFGLGDLNDIVALMQKFPLTRQAFLPIYFPEDTGLEARLPGTRIPCTLGYHFMTRDGVTQITYYLRSCDFVRHFRDDVYMTGRLLQWLCDKIGTQPGMIWANIVSLHAMGGDMHKLTTEEVF